MHVYIYIYTTMYIYNYVLYIYIYMHLYIYTQRNVMREDDCTDMCVDNFLFMAEQLRNVSAMDAVCALHHISTSGLLALGYIVMYIYTYVYIYIMCMYIHDFAWRYIYICTQLCIYTIYNYLSAAECVGGQQMDRGKQNNKWAALAGFEPVTICFRGCFKMPRELRGEGGFK